MQLYCIYFVVKKYLITLRIRLPDTLQIQAPYASNCFCLSTYSTQSHNGVMPRPKHKKNIYYFAQTNFRNQKDTFGILLANRLHHFYILGKTGTGKSTLLLNKNTTTPTALDHKKGLGLVSVYQAR